MTVMIIMKILVILKSFRKLGICKVCKRKGITIKQVTTMRRTVKKLDQESVNIDKNKITHAKWADAEKSERFDK